MNRKGRNILIGVVIGIVFLGLFIFGRILSPPGETGQLVFDDPTFPYVKMHVLDVGQACAVFVELPGHRTMLVDAGSASRADEVKVFIQTLGVKKIDYVIATHPHADHIGGMDTLMESFDIGRMYMPDVKSEDGVETEMLTLAKQKGLTIERAAAGVVLLDEPDLSIELLAPIHASYDDINTYSAVVKVSYQNNTFLLMGDATAVTEKEMMLYGADLDADVLLVAHHGADTSTDKEFLDVVSPQYAVISVGENNSYGFPSSAVSERLAAKGVRVYRTDKHGTVTFLGNGQRIAVRTEKQ